MPNTIYKRGQPPRGPLTLGGIIARVWAELEKIQRALSWLIAVDESDLEITEDGHRLTIGLKDTGVTPGTWTKVTVDVKGRVTEGALISASDIPPLPYDPSGAAFNAELRARAYADEQVAAIPEMPPSLFEPAGAANRAVSDARRYTDAAVTAAIAAIPAPLALYEPAGAANRAVSDARRYTDLQLASLSASSTDGLLAGLLFLTP
jgi:hypothetical protein